MNTKKTKKTTKSVGYAGWADLFASRTLAQLLTTFLTHPQKDFYQKELAVTADAGLYAVQRELARLEKADLVSRTPRGHEHRIGRVFSDRCRARNRIS